MKDMVQISDTTMINVSNITSIVVCDDETIAYCVDGFPHEIGKEYEKEVLEIFDFMIWKFLISI